MAQPKQSPDDSKQPLDLRGWLPPKEHPTGSNVLDLRQPSAQDFYEAHPASLITPNREGVPVAVLLWLAAVAVLAMILLGVNLALDRQSASSTNTAQQDSDTSSQQAVKQNGKPAVGGGSLPSTGSNFDAYLPNFATK